MLIEPIIRSRANVQPFPSALDPPFSAPPDHCPFGGSAPLDHRSPAAWLLSASPATLIELTIPRRAGLRRLRGSRGRADSDLAEPTAAASPPIVSATRRPPEPHRSAPRRDPRLPRPSGCPPRGINGRLTMLWSAHVPVVHATVGIPAAGRVRGARTPRIAWTIREAR